MNDYTNSLACKMLATNCLICGRPLVDAVSVTIGLGPECREGFNRDLTDETRKIANKLVFEASMAAAAGRITVVRDNAEKVRALGYGDLADKMGRRFVKADRLATIKIIQYGEVYKVETPYRRKDSKAFVEAWRSIPGRRWINGENVVPVTSKMALWKVLKQFFGGKYAKGPKGVFKIPKPELALKQTTMKFA